MIGATFHKLPSEIIDPISEMSYDEALRINLEGAKIALKRLYGEAQDDTLTNEIQQKWSKYKQRPKPNQPYG